MLLYISRVDVIQSIELMKIKLNKFYLERESDGEENRNDGLLSFERQENLDIVRLCLVDKEDVKTERKCKNCEDIRQVR